MSICAASFAFAQNNNTGAAASQQAAAEQPQEKVAESLADLKLGSKVLDRFSASVTVGYESAYVFRGIKEAGATYTVKNITFDTGVITYIYPDGNDEWEWKFAVSYDTTELLGDFNVCPSIAYFYNNELDTNTLELGLSYSAPVMKWINGDNWLSIDSSIIYGYIAREGSNAKAYSGAYSYFQLKSDVRIAVTDYCSYSFGIRYSWASDNAVRGSGPYASPDIMADEKGNVWFGTAISFGF